MAATAYMLPGVKLFASGEYRGKPWPPSVLRRMADNARKLGPSGLKLLVPPSVLGHEEEQEWLARTDLPAAGWVDPDSVRVVPDADNPGHAILTGDVVNVPAEVAAKIESGEFKFCSSEIYDDFKDDFGKSHGKTLRRLAFLGGEVPQVKRLGSLPRPVPMAAPMQFSERRGVFVRERVEAGVVTAFAEPVDRSRLTAAVQAALPNLSSAFLDKLSDDDLAELTKAVPTPDPNPQPDPAMTNPMDPAGMGAGMGMGVPAPGGAPGMTPPADPYQQAPLEFADMSQEELIAALTEMGQDPEELAAMPPEELQALYDELSAEGGDAEEEEVEEMADPAAMTREELIAELTAAGQDPAALGGMSDDDLRKLYAEAVGGAAAVAPAAPVATPMSEGRGKKKKKRTTAFAEGRRLTRRLRMLNTFAEREARRLQAAAAQAKRRDAESFCEQLVRDGRATPAQVRVLHLPLLLSMDNARPVHTFTENNVTRRETAFERKKRELAALPKVVHFGERLPGDRAGQGGKAEAVARARRFAEVNAGALRHTGQTPEQFVTKFGEMYDKDADGALQILPAEFRN